ncbi:MAG: ADP-ribosylation factor-like protein [Candidatus Jordarchaeaceae archaeon]
MIYGLLIFDRNGRNFFQKFYGSGNVDVEQKLIRQFAKELTTLTYSLNHSERVACVNLEKLKFFYSISKDIIIVLCTDQNEDVKDINDKLIKIQGEFAKLFSTPPKEESKPGEPKAEDHPLKVFEKTVDKILIPYLKTVIVGDGGVGKTTLLKLIMGENTNATYIPTVGVEVKEFDDAVKNTNIIFWDFSGQPHFRKLWKTFLEGTDIAILVTDSTPKNVEETKRIYHLIKEEKPDLNLILIANKQDLPGATPPEDIGKYVGIKAYGLVAIDPNYRKKILEILKEKVTEITKAKSKISLSLDVKA